MKYFLYFLILSLITTKTFASNSQSHYWRNATLTEASALAGVYYSEQNLYPGQHDKQLHARTGLGISTITTLVSLAGAYTISDSTISAKWKDRIIGCAGPMMATLAGVIKEMKDRSDPTHHTADSKDAIATSLGGGFPLGCVFSLTF